MGRFVPRSILILLVFYVLWNSAVVKSFLPRVSIDESVAKIPSGITAGILKMTDTFLGVQTSDSTDIVPACTSYYPSNGAPNSIKELTDLCKIVDSFPESKFTPSILVRNCHWQTIVGSGALGSKFFGDPVRRFSTIPERFNTADGDFFDVEFTDNFVGAEKLVVLLHGLESNIRGPLITSFTQALTSPGRDFGCALVSFRGCNGEENM